MFKSMFQDECFQELFCKTITIFLKTSKYQEKIYANSKTYNFIEATNDTRIIWKISKNYYEIYRKNFLYNKVGVILSDLCCDIIFNKVY